MNIDDTPRSVHESDVAFINDDAVVDGEADTRYLALCINNWLLTLPHSSDDARFAASAAEKNVRLPKGKASQQVKSDVGRIAVK